jgi:hypothetical protein
MSFSQTPPRFFLIASSNRHRRLACQFVDTRVGTFLASVDSVQFSIDVCGRLCALPAWPTVSGMSRGEQRTRYDQLRRDMLREQGCI